MKYRRAILTLAIVSVPVAGCSPDWYARDADRDVARIVEQRKEETLKYKPQTEAKTPAHPDPSPQAYEKIPLTQMPKDTLSPLERQTLQWTPEPLGPKMPLQEKENYDFVPPSYASYGVAMDPQGPPLPGEETVALDMLKSLEYAVTHARDYQDRMEDLYLATLDVTLQRHLFEPIPFADTTFGYAQNAAGPSQRFDAASLQGNAGYKQALQVVNRAGIRQQLPYGGTIAAQQLVTITDGLNKYSQDGQSAESALTASIPLLKGAGLVNLEPLISSERQLVYTVRAFETYRRQFVVSVSSRFFSLVSQQQSIKNRRQNYENLKLLSERSLALYVAGRIQYLDVQRALQNQLNAESSLIDAINGYQSSLDSFKMMVGMPVMADLEIVPVEMQVNLPDFENIDSVAQAMKYRLDLQTARDEVEDAKRGVANAKNGLLPSVNFDAAAGYTNIPGQNWNRYNDDTGFANAAIRIDWPLDQLAERNTYRASLINFARVQRQYVTQREQVVTDVRSSMRQLRATRASLEIQRTSVQLNQRRLDLANARFVQGKIGVLDVVDAQSALLNAQDALNNARANLQTQVLQYLRDTGTLRLNPEAGQLARAMDRAAVQVKYGDLFDHIETDVEKLEKQ